MEPTDYWTYQPDPQEPPTLMVPPEGPEPDSSGGGNKPQGLSAWLWALLIVTIVALLAGSVASVSASASAGTATLLALTQQQQRPTPTPTFSSGFLHLVGGATPTPKPGAPATTPKPSKTVTPTPTAVIPMTPTPVTAPATGPTPTAAATLGQPLAQETFQRADQAGWGIASDGHLWGSNAKKQPQVFTVAGMQGQITGTGTQTYEDAVLGPAATDVDVEAVGHLSQFQEDGGTNLGVVARWTSTTSYYKAYIDGIHLVIMKRMGQRQSTLGSFPFTAQSGVAYALHFQVIGTQLVAKAWVSTKAEPRQWLVIAQDSSLKSGKVGVRVLLRQGVTATFQSFIASRLSTTPGQVPATPTTPASLCQTPATTAAPATPTTGTP